MKHYDVVIAGAGATGLMAAVRAAQSGHNVLLIEKMEKPARKVRITGKGRCNLTNRRIESDFLERVHGSADFFRPAFQHFNNEQTIAFFEEIGVPLTTERGERVFPTSGKAWDVADALVRRCRELGVETRCLTRVAEVQTRNGAICGVTLQRKTGEQETVPTSRLIIATGGVSYPSTGSTGDGYQLAYDLGHRIESVRPSLVPLESDASWIGPLRGLSLKNVKAQLHCDAQCVEEEFGEMEFTSFGVSGPIILKLSRTAVDALIDEKRVELHVDLKPALSTVQICNRIGRETEALSAHASLRDLLKKLLPGQLIDAVVTVAGLPPTLPLRALSEAQITTLITTLKGFCIPICDYRPFAEAIITAGGVDTAEIDPETLESRLIEGLYLAGEVLDLDADTGGYNLQIAFSTGSLAGMLRTHRTSTPQKP